MTTSRRLSGIMGLVVLGAAVGCGAGGGSSGDPAGSPGGTGATGGSMVELDGSGPAVATNTINLSGGDVLSVESRWEAPQDGAGAGTGTVADPFPSNRLFIGVVVHQDPRAPGAEDPRILHIEGVRMSEATGGAMTIVEDTCTGIQVSGGTAQCSIVVEFAPRQAGEHSGILSIDIPSHQVVQRLSIERHVPAPGSADPVEPPTGEPRPTDLPVPSPTGASPAPEPPAPEPPLPPGATLPPVEGPGPFADPGS